METEVLMHVSPLLTCWMPRGMMYLMYMPPINSSCNKTKTSWLSYTKENSYKLRLVFRYSPAIDPDIPILA